MNQKRTLIATVIAIMSLSATVLASEAQDTPSLLKKACDIFSQQWVGLQLHYKGGKREFDRRCRTAIGGKDVLPGLWTIRSLVPDGHAGFLLKDLKKSLMHPILLTYDPEAQDVSIAVVHDKRFAKYIGQKVILINGERAVDRIRTRAKLEPQSTQASGMEIAARTLLMQPDWRPYPDFQEDIVLTLENGEEVATKAVSLDALWEKDRHILSKDYPSIWGNTIGTERSTCENKDEIAKIISYQDSKWLWWHPTSMKFHSEDMTKALTCWSQNIGKVSGVILDLRDTGGGLLKHMMAISSMLSPIDHIILQKKVSDNPVKMESRVIGAPEGTPRRWRGRVVMMTNGLCGSACDQLAKNIAENEDVCTYGSSTAGRTNSEEEIKLNDDVLLQVPVWAHYDSAGSDQEGKPFIPRHQGNGGVFDALDACAYLSHR